MTTAIANLYAYHALKFTLAWKNIALRYKPAYLGTARAMLEPDYVDADQDLE